MTEMKIDNFQDLAEIVAIQNFEAFSGKVIQNHTKPVYKKAVLISKAPKKAVLISKPDRKIVRGIRFTPKKNKMHGRVIHYTNVKNAFKRAQKQKSRKGR